MIDSERALISDKVASLESELKFLESTEVDTQIVKLREEKWKNQANFEELKEKIISLSKENKSLRQEVQTQV